MSRTLDDKIKFGLVGCGFVANTHAEILTKINNVRLSCICDTDKVRLESFANKYGVQNKFTDFNKMLNQDIIDAVIIATPSWLHSQMIIQSAKAGKHILVEKPLALNLKEANNAIRVCKKERVKLSVVYQYRFCPPAKRLKELTEKKILGDLVAGQAQAMWSRSKDYFREAEWRSKKSMAGGGAMLHQSIHLVDLLQWYFGKVKHVSSCVDNIVHKLEVEDVAAALIKFQSGAIATIITTTTSPIQNPPSVTVHGTKGIVSIENFKEGGTVKALGIDISNLESSYPKFDTRLELPIYARNHAAQILNFVEAVKGKESLLVDGAEAKKSLEIVLKIYESAR